MRGAGDQLRVGERIAFYRHRRGMTQRVLADLVGRSEDWLSKIERGERDIRRLDVLADVAVQLRVTIADLLGQPVLMEDTEPYDDDVPAIRNALMNHQRLSPTMFGPVLSRTVDLDQVQQLADYSWQDYQNGRLGRVVSALPGLIKSGQALEDLETTAAFRLSSRIHHLAASVLSKVGESDLAWIAGQAAMHAAERSGDPLALASAARAGTHALLAVGRYADAIDLGQTAAGWLAKHMRAGDHEALSLIGMLRLRTAIASARHQDRSLTVDLLDRAQRAADAIGHDANHWYTAFGPTNVAVHRIATSLELEDVSYVLATGPGIDTRALPMERSISHEIDLARANSYVARDDEALARLLDAEQKSPQIVRHSATARETVKAMQRRSRAAATSPLHQLAARCRVLP